MTSLSFSLSLSLSFSHIDDHCDIVPFLHSLYRHLQRDNPADMLHIDAHPDFSLPSGRQCQSLISEWRDPDTLTELLSEDGGIAEFIIPLIAQSLLGSVYWMRSDTASTGGERGRDREAQFPDGWTKFTVFEPSLSRSGAGSLSPLVRVTCALPYYLDEGVFAVEDCPSSDNESEREGENSSDSDSERESFPVNLFTFSHPTALSPTVSRKDWVLDICLDYFYVQNPFLLETLRSLSPDDSDRERESERVAVLKRVMALIEGLPYRRGEGERESQLKALQAFLRDPLSLPLRDAFLSLSPSLSLSAMALETLGKDIDTHIAPATRELCAKYHTLLLLPHDWGLGDARTFLSSSEFARKVDLVEATMRAFLLQRNGRLPLCVTIARSVSDEYLPGAALEEVERRVRDMLDRVFASHSLSLAFHDLTEDPHDKAYWLFVPESVRKMMGRD